jgi:hypothetical protein
MVTRYKVEISTQQITRQVETSTMDEDFSTFERRFERLKELNQWTDEQAAEAIGYTRSWWMKLKKDQRVPKPKVWKALKAAEDATPLPSLSKAMDTANSIIHSAEKVSGRQYALAVYLRREGERMIALADQIDAIADDTPISQALDLRDLDFPA